MGGSAAEWLACWTQAKKARVQIAAATLSGNSLRQTVHMTHVTRRLTAQNRDQLRNLKLGNRVWATFTFLTTKIIRTSFYIRNISHKNACCRNQWYFQSESKRNVIKHRKSCQIAYYTYHVYQTRFWTGSRPTTDALFVHLR